MTAKNKIKTGVSPTPKSQTPAKGAPRETGPLRLEFGGEGRRFPYWAPLVVFLVIALAIYGQGIGYGYVLDDEIVIHKNEYVKQGFGGLRKIFSEDSFSGYFADKSQLYLLEGGRYRPLSLATFAIEWGIFGPEKYKISHIVNILWYVLTTFLLFRILARLFPLREGRHWYFSVPFLSALIYIAHPLHVEAIANIKGRDEIMALFFSLASLYAMLRYTENRSVSWLWGAAASMFLGLLSKENALTFLAVIPLTLWFFGKKKGSGEQGVSMGALASLMWPLLAAAALFILVRYRALGFMLDHGRAITDLMNQPFMEMNGMEKLATIFLTLGWYVKLLIYPHPLTHDYYPYHVPKVNWSDWRAASSLILYGGLVAWTLYGLPRRKVSAYAIAFFLITLSIVSNLVVSVGTFMNERFMFMPSVGYALLLGWFFARPLARWVSAKEDQLYPLGALIFVGLFSAYAIRSVIRVPDWRDGNFLNEQAIKISKNSARANTFYVKSLYEDRYLKTTDPKEKAMLVDTMQHYIDKALKIYPNYTSALQMYAGVAAARFEQDKQLDRLFNDFEYLLEKIPYNVQFRNFLDQYMQYLDGSNADKYVPFCYRVGYEFFYKQKNDLDSAIKFLEYGRARENLDVRIFDALAELYELKKEPAKAAEMRRRAFETRNM